MSLQEDLLKEIKENNSKKKVSKIKTKLAFKDKIVFKPRGLINTSGKASSIVKFNGEKNVNKDWSL